jgi:IMP and pyridine-specific 5'-nucleotidase
MLLTDRKDGLIDWMKDMLYHSFVLDEKTSYLGTMQYFESLIEEHRCFSLRLQNELNDNIFAAKSGQSKIDSSRLKQYVPSVGVFFTPLPLLKAFKLYDEKYCISERNFVAPSFNEIRHILNLAQIMVIIPYNYYIYFYMSNFLGYWN